MSRVEKLIDFLLDTDSSIYGACKELGFWEEDLTSEELDELCSRIFQCDRCYTWHDMSEEEFAPMVGSVCYQCLLDIEKEEDEYED